MSQNENHFDPNHIYILKQKKMEPIQENKQPTINYQRKTIRRLNSHNNLLNSNDNNVPIFRLNTINKNQNGQIDDNQQDDDNNQVKKQKFTIRQHHNFQQIMTKLFLKHTQPFKQPQMTLLKDEKLRNQNQLNANKNKLEKLQHISKYKYLNPLARLQYEDRQIEIYTKTSAKSRKSILNKIKAKNQLAQFEDSHQEDNNIDDLIEFKMGKLGPNGSYIHYKYDPVEQKQLHNSIHLDDMINNVINDKSEKQMNQIGHKTQQNIKKQKAFYCKKCDKLIPQHIYKDTHNQKCNFIFSEDPVKMSKQIIQKLENIQKILNKLDENQSMKILKSCLKNSINSDLKIDQSIKQIKNLKQQDSQLIEALKKRIILLLTQKMNCNLLYSKSKTKQH